MAVIVEADVMEVANRGKVCIATLDAYPLDLRVGCVIGGIHFAISPVHMHWMKPDDAKPIIGLALEGRNLSADWFVGRQVTPT